MNERGTYGDRSKSGIAPFAVLLGLTAVVYGLSPGALHFYKHGRLPRAENTTRWRP